jgi:transcriptional regulator with XRE-family HTH domain
VNLTEVRFHKRLTQWDLKVRTGINQTKISLIERGYVFPRDEEKQKLAMALGLTVDEIDWPQIPRGARAQPCEACLSA